jgi:predicted nucleotidyltransferase
MNIQNKIGRILAAHPRLGVGILFGSVSRGGTRADSDIDVAVAGARPLDSGEKLALVEEIAVETGRPVDLIDLQASGGLILQQVLTKGKLVYCPDRNLYAELIKRMLFEQADFMPYHRRLLRERRRAWIGS